MDRETEELLETLHRLSGMTVTLYDSNFHGLMGYPQKREAPSFCSLLHRALGNTEECLSSDARARRTCMELGGLYSYRCPLGLFEAIAPIRRGGLTVGYLVMGQSLPKAKEAEATLREALAARGLSDTEVLDAIERLPRHSDAQYLAFCRTLSVFAEHLANREKGFAGSESLAQMTLRYLKRHYAERISLPELSLHFHCSTVTLTQAFRNAYGNSILQTLYEIRLERAKELLTTTDASVTEIALASGFCDAGSFFKRFRREVGMTPTQWRERSN